MTQVPAGWYRDPAAENADGRTLRYWDGHSWNQHVRRSDAAQPTDGPYPDRPYVAPEDPRTPDGQVLAGWWSRAAATAADALIVSPLLLLAAAPSLAAHWDSVRDWWNDGQRAGSSPTLVTDGSVPNPPVLDPTTGPGLLLYASLFAASALYTLAFLRWKQATPGKLIMGLRVRRRERPGLPWPAILPRYALIAALSMLALAPSPYELAALPFVLDYLWPLWDDKKQALHDKVAGTSVVRVSWPDEQQDLGIL